MRHGGRVLDYLTQGVFPFYIVHQTIIVVAEFWLKTRGLPAVQEGLILVVVTVRGCFASDEIVRRVGWLRPLSASKRCGVLPGGTGFRPLTA